jgi:hypothetical protein
MCMISHIPFNTKFTFIVAASDYVFIWCCATYSYINLSPYDHFITNLIIMISLWRIFLRLLVSLMGNLKKKHRIMPFKIQMHFKIFTKLTFSLQGPLNLTWICGLIWVQQCHHVWSSSFLQTPTKKYSGFISVLLWPQIKNEKLYYYPWTFSGSTKLCLLY